MLHYSTKAKLRLELFCIKICTVEGAPAVKSKQPLSILQTDICIADFNCSIFECNTGSAAEEEDSYTKEETKTPRFVNLVHAASIQKQVAGQPVAANGHTPRSGAYASEDPFAQQSVEQMERSGLVTSSLSEPLEQQVSSSRYGNIMVKSDVRYLGGGFAAADM